MLPAMLRRIDITLLLCVAISAIRAGANAVINLVFP